MEAMKAFVWSLLGQVLSKFNNSDLPYSPPNPIFKLRFLTKINAYIMKSIFNILLVCLLSTGVALACPGHGDKASTNMEKSENGAKAEVTFASLDLKVVGMTCGGCENKVKAALSGIDGVVETKKVCSESDQASLTYDPSVVSEEQIIAALGEKTGYSITVITSGAKTEAGAEAETSAVKKSCASAEKAKACSSAEKKACTKAEKAACEKSKASADKELEKAE